MNKPWMIQVDNAMQTNYQYALIMPVGDLSDLPNFKPELTPFQMLEYGVFGGKYFGDIPDTTEYNEEFRELIRRKSAGVGKPYDVNLNYFKVDASQSLTDWVASGWVREQDPRGWFEWYCRTWFGRRSPDDNRQIGRWSAITRHIGQIKKHCEIGDHNCRPRQRQALLHWAYDTVGKY
jgi:hypothetical protein